MLAQGDVGNLISPTTLTVREFIEGTWIPSLESSDLRESTVESYRRSVKSHVLPPTSDR